MYDRITLLNYLITRYGYQKYLEIGCKGNECFNQIKASNKTGVDPVSGGTVKKTSDAYFASLDSNTRFDIVFIDGLHHCEQVDRDIANSLKHLNPGGTIVLHDCKPTDEAVAAYPYQGSYNWTGDVWKAVVAWRRKPNVDVCVVDFDWGCGVLRVRPNTKPLKLEIPTLLTWKFYEENTRQLLNLKTVPEFMDWLEE